MLRLKETFLKQQRNLSFSVEKPEQIPRKNQFKIYHISVAIDRLTLLI